MQWDEFGVESYVWMTNESQLAFLNQSCLIVIILGMFQLFVNSWVLIWEQIQVRQEGCMIKQAACGFPVLKKLTMVCAGKGGWEGLEKRGRLERLGL